MYQLEPMREWELFQKSARPAQKKDAHGQLMWVDHPEKPGKLVEVLDFSILPEKVCDLNLEGVSERPADKYRLELWKSGGILRR